MSKYIRMVEKLSYRYLESVMLKFITTVPTRELSQHFMSLRLQSTSELLCVLPVLQLTRYEQISGLTNSDFRYRLNSLLREYKDISEGVGALQNFEFNIPIDHSVQSCVQKPKRLPFLMKKQVENEIQKLLEQDFIEPVTSSPKWVSPLVFVLKKNGDVRFCADTCNANTSIIRNYYPIP